MAKPGPGGLAKEPACKQVFYGAFPVTVHHMAMFGVYLLTVFVSQTALES